MPDQSPAESHAIVLTEEQARALATPNSTTGPAKPPAHGDEIKDPLTASVRESLITSLKSNGYNVDVANGRWALEDDTSLDSQASQIAGVLKTYQTAGSDPQVLIAAIPKIAEALKPLTEAAGLRDNVYSASFERKVFNKILEDASHTGAESVQVDDAVSRLDQIAKFYAPYMVAAKENIVNVDTLGQIAANFFVNFETKHSAASEDAPDLTASMAAQKELVEGLTHIVENANSQIVAKGGKPPFDPAALAWNLASSEAFDTFVPADTKLEEITAAVKLMLTEATPKGTTAKETTEITVGDIFDRLQKLTINEGPKKVLNKDGSTPTPLSVKDYVLKVRSMEHSNALGAGDSAAHEEQNTIKT